MHDEYNSPLCSRYSSKEMKKIFSDDEKFSTWRKLWVALAESEKELGLNISNEQIEELKAHINDIDYDLANRFEKEVRHDVMAHVKTYGECCPNAKGIIHLGATSCYVGDNTDIILMKKALLQIKKLLVNCMNSLKEFASKNAKVYTLAYTHFQAAQPTTLGKRATLWLNDLMLDYENLEFQLSRLKLLGCKGTTGTSASFLQLFDGDKEKVLKLEQLIAQKMGFDSCYPVSGQTYSRKVDFDVLTVLSGIAQSASKFANDFRLMSHLKEVDEPFEKLQIGSSAMAYKRNPMRCERINSLSRYVIVDLLNPSITSSTQWLERTLDDSANKRISIPEAFLATDAILSLYINVISNCSVYPVIMKKHLDDEVPFLATENILMYCTNEKGKDRQELHELIRKLSVETAKEMKETGCANNLLEKILKEPAFGISKKELSELSSPDHFVGLAEEQTIDFIENYINPILDNNKELIGMDIKINV